MSARPGCWVCVLGVALFLDGAWQWLFLAGAVVLAWIFADQIEEALGRTLGAARRRARRRDLDRERLEQLLAQARRDQALAVPGACEHRQAEPVNGIGGDLLAWLCPDPECGMQLPADFSVPEKDR